MLYPTSATAPSAAPRFPAPGEREVHIFLRILLPQTEANAGPRLICGHSHRRQNMRRLDRAGRTCCTGRDRQSFQVERDDQSLPLDTVEVNVSGIRHARSRTADRSPRIRPASIPSSSLSSRSRRAAIFQSSPRSKPARANSAALPNPTIPGTFSVPARRERSWLPAVKHAARSLVPLRTYSAPTPCGRVQLVAGDRQQIAPNLTHVDRNLPCRLHARRYESKHRPRRQSCQSRQRLHAPQSHCSPA